MRLILVKAQQTKKATGREVATAFGRRRRRPYSATPHVTTIEDTQGLAPLQTQRHVIHPDQYAAAPVRRTGGPWPRCCATIATKQLLRVYDCLRSRKP